MTCAQSCLIRSRATASFRVIITTLQSCSIRKDKSLSFPSTIIIIADFAKPGPIAEANSKPSTDPSKLRMLSSGRVILGIILTFLSLFTFMSHYYFDIRPSRKRYHFVFAASKIPIYCFLPGQRL